MATKDFVVSADGHLLEPIDLFKTRLPSTCATWRCGRRSSRSSRFVEGGATVFRKLHTPGFEGWTVSRYRQTQRPHARGRSRDHPRGHGPRRRRRPGDAPEPVAVRPLHRPPRDVDRPRPRLQRLRHRAVHAVLRPPGAHRARSRSPTSTTPSPRSSGSPPAGSGRCCCPPPRRCRTTRATSTRCGPRSRPAACSVFVHTQTGGVKVNDPEAHTLKVDDGERRSRSTSR